MPALRTQMGFVDPASVTVGEFEAALRFLVPRDGSAPRLGADVADTPLTELLHGHANVQRLKPFQRQRATRLAQRMRNFGYAREAISLLCRTLFLTKLHDRDLWAVWVMLHPTPPQRPAAGGAAAGAPPPPPPGAGDDDEGAAAGGGGRPKWSTEAPLDVTQVRHLLARGRDLP